MCLPHLSLLSGGISGSKAGLLVDGKAPTCRACPRNPMLFCVKDVPPVCMCFCSRSSLFILRVRCKGLVVCCAKVLPMGASSESNPTNFTPGPSLAPGVPVSQTEGKWLACRIALLCARRYCLERVCFAWEL